jgi:uncharacterized protein YfiM (DUF2279 family)
MKLRGLVLGLVLLLGLPATARGDVFERNDKATHAGVSFVLAGAGYTLGRLAIVPERPRAARLCAVALGLGVALIVGAAKEGVDANGAGDPSALDFAADAVGASAGIAIAFTLDLVLAPRRR